MFAHFRQSGLRITVLTETLMLLALVAADRAVAQPRRGPAGQGPTPTIEEKTAGMRKMDGFFPLYWDESAGQLWMEIARLGVEVLHITGLASGLGSNDIGLDRGELSGSRIVLFERAGPKILMVQPNYRFRARSDNPAEVRAVRDAFARSVVWGFSVAAETGGRVLVDLTEFLLRDGSNMAQRLRPGTYRFDSSRSSLYMPMTVGFPNNTEMEAELTFVLQPGGGPASGPFTGGGRGSFEGVGDVAANREAASLRVHHSLVALPDADYKPRSYDPRSGYGAIAYDDYAAPLGQPMTQRLLRRHRLRKVDPSAPASEAVKPIVYYLDPGVPEPVRSALLEGARWWNQAFEAIGYRNGFRVEFLPEGVSPLDVRYNVINWVHRSTRGWSSGATVTDPRTGEIIKGVVTLGSLRARQDYLIAEGLLSPYRTGDETPPELREWALARIRQLSAHEVGHTLGLGHNYYDSRAGRISVMDYPHPLVTLKSDGSLDYSAVYAKGIGEWDKVAIAYGYQDFAGGTDEKKALTRILDEAWAKDLRYMTNQDLGVHPRVDQWSNGTDSAAELNRMMDVRRAALARFGENAIRRDTPMAAMEEVLVPLYLHHRYQVEAAASALGGIDYIYALRGDGRDPVVPVAAAQQRSALDALLATLRPAELILPAAVLKKLPPRPSGFGYHRELFPRYTGAMFDAVTPAVVASELTVSNMLDSERAARLVEQHALDPSLPGLKEVLDRLIEGTFDATASTTYEEEVRRAVKGVVIHNLIELAGTARMPQVRAIAAMRLRQLMYQMGGTEVQTTEAEAAHHHLLAADIQRFLERSSEPSARPRTLDIPPGAPIGEPALEWLPRQEPACSSGGEQ